MKEQKLKIFEERIQLLKSELKNCKLNQDVAPASAEFLSGVLDQSLAGIYVIHEGKFVYVNKTFATIFGYESPADIVGKFPITELVAPECKELVKNNVKRRQTRQCNEIRYTFTGLRKDGSRNLVEVHGRSMMVGGLRTVIGVIIDITTYASMREMAYRDSLTQLPNRALFMDRLARAITQAKRSGNKFTLLYIDLDGFKQVNDTVGHAAGDYVLQKTAQRMRKLIRRETDTISRLGGDEFATLLCDTCNRNYCIEFAQKILSEIRHPMNFCNQVISVGASIGISIFPDNGKDPESIIGAADMAMYEAKKNGKNTFVFAGD